MWGSAFAYAEAAISVDAARLQAVTATSADTRTEVRSLSHDLYDNRIFDAYLHFNSAEDEEAFRKREADAKRYLATQLAKTTPEGDLNAAGCLEGQMLDLHAHGAGASPDFLPRWNALVEKAERQHAAMHAAGQSTAEYDSNLLVDVRSYLKARRLTDEEIEKLLAGSSNPLEAVKPSLADDHASQSLIEKLRRGVPSPSVAPAQTSLKVETVDTTVESAAPLTIDPDMMTAKLKAAGLQVTDATSEPTSGHGLTVQKPATKPGLTRPT